jgi:hypothetical protein
MITNSPTNNNPPHPAKLPILALKPALVTKQFGSEDILAALVAEAALAVVLTGEKGFNFRCVTGFFFPFLFLWCVGRKQWG